MLYLESSCDGIWRNHVPESTCVTSTTTEDPYKDNWMIELDSEVAGSSKDTHRIQPEPKTQSSRTGRPVDVQESTKEIEKGTLFDHEDVKHSTRTGRPVCGSESTQSCVLMPTKIEEDQTRTGRPVKVEEHDIDFRVPGLSHAVVKEAEHLRVQELVKKIESHPHREALQADLQQNNVYNPFSKKSEAMIRELGNEELFELCETIPKVQCSQCLYWNRGVIYCTCGQFLVESESRRKFNKLRLDALSISHYVIRKDAVMVLDTAKPKNKKSTKKPGMRGRDAARKLTLKVDILQVFTIDSSEIQFIANHNSQSDGQNQSAKKLDEVAEEEHIVSLQRKREDTKDKGFLP